MWHLTSHNFLCIPAVFMIHTQEYAIQSAPFFSYIRDAFLTVHSGNTLAQNIFRSEVLSTGQLRPKLKMVFGPKILFFILFTQSVLLYSLWPSFLHILLCYPSIGTPFSLHPRDSVLIHTRYSVFTSPWLVLRYQELIYPQANTKTSKINRVAPMLSKQFLCSLTVFFMLYQLARALSTTDLLITIPLPHALMKLHLHYQLALSLS